MNVIVSERIKETAVMQAEGLITVCLPNTEIVQLTLAAAEKLSEFLAAKAKEGRAENDIWHDLAPVADAEFVKWANLHGFTPRPFDQGGESITNFRQRVIESLRRLS